MYVGESARVWWLQPSHIISADQAVRVIGMPQRKLHQLQTLGNVVLKVTEVDAGATS